MANKDFLNEIQKKFLENLNNRANRMEIERKFLIKGIPGYLWNYDRYIIEQHYLSFNPEIRIRKSNGDCTLTVKSEGHQEREEIEIAITDEQFDNLKKFTKGDGVCKIRYIINENDNVYELDVYNNIEGLITVEVEFAGKQEADDFDIPKWFADEVTHIKEFKNKELAQFGLPSKLICPHCMGMGYFESENNDPCEICGSEGSIGLNRMELSKYNQIIYNKS